MAGPPAQCRDSEVLLERGFRAKAPKENRLPVLASREEWVGGELRSRGRAPAEARNQSSRPADVAEFGPTERVARGQREHPRQGQHGRGGARVLQQQDADGSAHRDAQTELGHHCGDGPAALPVRDLPEDQYVDEHPQRGRAHRAVEQHAARHHGPNGTTNATISGTSASYEIPAARAVEFRDRLAALVDEFGAIPHDDDGVPVRFLVAF